MSRKKLQTRKIVLASSSPRRKELLALTGLHFTVGPSDCEEELFPHMPPERLARSLSLQKARAVSHKYKGSIIIAADTFIVHKGKFLGKPGTKKEAGEMLSRLSGSWHFVITGVTLLDTRTDKRVSFSEKTKVYFRRLSRADIKAYIKTGEPLDKAGAYAIQGTGSIFIRKIEGDYFNVVGLPLSALAYRLGKLGVSLPVCEKR